ncbi:LysR family transcriptional regulator [Labrys sp. LIt4]|uniref:LysR substrate-binding domain-containing protein n=1 Tax=Labrys sp. LIt4 TaxID=2821355 RepID=UPI001AE03514|nr:LysR substrate-binding domain-containing protein [Labrys sp. LIt4]MBP0582743.1 LysR family transcriptional regulator [Labrys sp. LIt4]
MDLSSLDIFLAVADEQSVTRASSRLGRVPSNVTTRVKQLEQELGAALFSREGKRMRLTQEGEVFLTYANRLIALADEARGALKPSGPAGSFRVGTMESTAASRLPPVLAKFHAAWPAVSLKLITGGTKGLIRQLLAHDLDCALIGQPSVEGIDTGYDAGRLEGERVFTEDLLIVLPPRHPPIAEAADLRVDSLAALEPGCTYRAVAEHWGRGARRLRVQELASYHAMLAAVSTGNAIGVMPRSVLDLLPGGSEVQTHPLGRIETLLVRRRGEASPAFEAFRRALVEG